MRKIKEILETVTDYLNKNNIDYVFVGGIAVIVYGNPRTTVDLDLIVRLNEKEIETFSKYLQNEGFFCDPKDIKSAFEEGTHFSAEEKESLFRLDIIGVNNKRAEKTLKNRNLIEHEGINMYVASPEDTIANKLLYGSEQDIKDAESVFIRQMENLDDEYLQKLCEQIGVEEKFNTMKEEIEDIQKK